jgi:hypothetical protein
MAVAAAAADRRWSAERLRRWSLVQDRRRETLATLTMSPAPASAAPAKFSAVPSRRPAAMGSSSWLVSDLRLIVVAQLVENGHSAAYYVAHYAGTL